MKEHTLYTISGNGVYVTSIANHKQTSVLLDSGATISIIEEDMWRKSGAYSPENLKQLHAILLYCGKQRKFTCTRPCPS